MSTWSSQPVHVRENTRAHIACAPCVFRRRASPQRSMRRPRIFVMGRRPGTACQKRRTGNKAAKLPYAWQRASGSKNWWNRYVVDETEEAAASNTYYISALVSPHDSESMSCPHALMYCTAMGPPNSERTGRAVPSSACPSGASALSCLACYAAWKGPGAKTVKWSLYGGPGAERQGGYEHKMQRWQTCWPPGRAIGCGLVGASL